MSTTSKEVTPLVTHVSYFSLGTVGLSIASLCALFCIASGVVFGSWLASNPIWMTAVLCAFGASFIIMAAISMSQTARWSAITEKSSENVSSYLSEHYGISVQPSDCAVYCDVTPTKTPIKKEIPAEDLHTGNSVRITLKFSEDFTAVTPFVVTLLESRVLA